MSSLQNNKSFFSKLLRKIKTAFKLLAKPKEFFGAIGKNLKKLLSFLPNILTIIRIIMIPIIVIFIQRSAYSGNFLINIPFIDFPMNSSLFIALCLFLIAAFTDFLDGFIARKTNLVTSFGQIMDPISDKMLVLATLISLISARRDISLTTITIVLIFRDFIMNAVRMQILSSGEKDVSANFLGKAKTFLQIIWIVVIFFNNYPFQIWNFNMVLMLGTIVAMLAIYSMFDYIINNWKKIKINK